MNFDFFFQKICASVSETVGSDLPDLGLFTLLWSTPMVIILMIAIKTVRTQIALQEQSLSEVQSMVEPPKNMDSLILNLILMFLVGSSMVLYLMYWKG